MLRRPRQAARQRGRAAPHHWDRIVTRESAESRRGLYVVQETAMSSAHTPGDAEWIATFECCAGSRFTLLFQNGNGQLLQCQKCGKVTVIHIYNTRYGTT